MAAVMAVPGWLTGLTTSNIQKQTEAPGPRNPKEGLDGCLPVLCQFLILQARSAVFCPSATPASNQPILGIDPSPDEAASVIPATSNHLVIFAKYCTHSILIALANGTVLPR